MIDLLELLNEKTCPDCGDRWSAHCRTCRRCHAPTKGRSGDYRSCGCILQAPKRAKSNGANLWNGPMKRDRSSWRH
jgi:predicted amidophosphoribosyltransferase